MRAAPLGRIGQGFVLMAFPCLFAPAFLDTTQPELTNYIPLIRHPLYDVGLLLLALGLVAPVARLFVNLPGRRTVPPLAFALAVGGFVFCLALIAFSVAGVLLARRGDLMASHELLFWGGGHLLQYVYAIVLLTNWRILAVRSLGEAAVDDRVFRLAVGLIGALAIPAPFFYALFAPFSEAQHEAFRLLQFGIVVPTLIFAVSLAAKVLRSGRLPDLPWRDPAFFTLAVSLALFALGGVMGFLITGSDTRTPAHYHAVVTAVSVSSAGMLLTFGLDAIGAAPAPALATRILIGLYGGGQFVASIGMFVAGGYGALRKTPSGAASLDPVAAGGMAVHGIASIFTIIGGAAFVVVAIRSLARSRLGDAPRPARVARPANGSGWKAILVILVLAGLATAGVRAMRPGPGSDLLELHGLGPATLSAFVDAAGNPVSLESFRGKVVILNLWAPWCVPCLQEMRSLDRLAARLPERLFAVVAVSKDPVGQSPSKHTFDTMGLVNLKLYLDPKGALATDVGAIGFPTTLILGPDGAPLARREGRGGLGQRGDDREAREAGGKGAGGERGVLRRSDRYSRACPGQARL